VETTRGAVAVDIDDGVEEGELEELEAVDAGRDEADRTSGRTSVPTRPTLGG
jgi:hypothetical protein